MRKNYRRKNQTWKSREWKKGINERLEAIEASLEESKSQRKDLWDKTSAIASVASAFAALWALGPFGVIERAANELSRRNELASKTNRLEMLLAAKDWKEANNETYWLMMRDSERVGNGHIDSNSIEKLDCSLLAKIDELWSSNSGERFGFFIQKEIYKDALSNKRSIIYSEVAFAKFSESVGWRKKGEDNWISWQNLMFEKAAPDGHLPGIFGWLTLGPQNINPDDRIAFFSHLEMCK